MVFCVYACIGVDQVRTLRLLWSGIYSCPVIVYPASHSRLFNLSVLTHEVSKNEENYLWNVWMGALGNGLIVTHEASGCHPSHERVCAGDEEGSHDTFHQLSVLLSHEHIDHVLWGCSPAFWLGRQMIVSFEVWKMKELEKMGLTDGWQRGWWCFQHFLSN